MNLSRKACYLPSVKIFVGVSFSRTEKLQSYFRIRKNNYIVELFAMHLFPWIIQKIIVKPELKSNGPSKMIFIACTIEQKPKSYKKSVSTSFAV